MDVVEICPQLRRPPWRGSVFGLGTFSTVGVPQFAIPVVVDPLVSRSQCLWVAADLSLIHTDIMSNRQQLVAFDSNLIYLVTWSCRRKLNVVEKNGKFVLELLPETTKMSKQQRSTCRKNHSTCCKTLSFSSRHRVIAIYGRAFGRAVKTKKITRSIWKMLGPFATASRRTPPVLILHCHSPGVATVARRLRYSYS